MNCVVCGKPLTGGVDTFGEPDAPMCWGDWFDAQNKVMTTPKPESQHDLFPIDP